MPPARSGRSSPSRRCSRASTASRGTSGCRLPDGASLQILTTRDHDDPDALAVLRHSAAHLLAEAVRRLHPGVKVAIGPPIENGFYYDFEFPEPIREDDLDAIEAEIRREIAEGRAWAREEIGTRRRARAVRGRGRAVQGRARRHRRGRHLALHAGRLHRPLPRAAPPGRVTDQGGQADRARRRLLARRREEHAADADLRHGVLQPGRPRRAISSGSSRRARAITAGSARSSTCSTSTSTRRGRRSGTRRGWRSDNELEDVRRRENARRGYLEVKTPLIYDKSLWETSGHWEKFRENMFLIPGDDDEQTYGIKPMNCPGHMLLFGSQLRSYRDLPMRYAEAAPLHRNELTGTLHGLHPRAVRHAGRRAHLLHARSRSTTRSTLSSTTPRTSTGCSGWSRAPSSRRGPTTSSAPTTSGTSPRARCVEALERHGIAVRRRRGRGGVLRAEDRPPHERRRSGGRGRSGRSSRRADAGAVRAHVHGRRQPRAHAVSSSTARSSARSSGSSASSSSTTAARSRSGCRPCRCASLPVAERTAEAADELRRRALAAGVPRRRRRARRDARQADPRRRAGEDPVRGRLGRPRDATRRSPSGGAGARASRRCRSTARRRDPELLEPALSSDAGERRIPPRRERLLRCAPASRSGIAPHLAGHGPRGVQPSRIRRGNAAAACSGVVHE